MTDPDKPTTENVDDQEAKNILRLAVAVEQAALIEFHSGDREPGSPLTSRGRQWLIDGLKLLAKQRDAGDDETTDYQEGYQAGLRCEECPDDASVSWHLGYGAALGVPQEVLTALAMEGRHNQMHRSLIDIVGVRDDMVIALIPGWSPWIPVSFKLSSVPEQLQTEIKADAYLLADVNIGARQACDLRFANFEWCPQPRADEGLHDAC
jgi:hypothetical protein